MEKEISHGPPHHHLMDWPILVNQHVLLSALFSISFYVYFFFLLFFPYLPMFIFFSFYLCFRGAFSQLELKGQSTDRWEAMLPIPFWLCLNGPCATLHCESVWTLAFLLAGATINIILGLERKIMYRMNLGNGNIIPRNRPGQSLFIPDHGSPCIPKRFRGTAFISMVK